MARKVESPVPVHAAKLENIVPILVFGAVVVHGPAPSTVSSKLPVFVDTVATCALIPPLDADEKLSVGLASADRAAAVLQKIAPFSVGQVTPTGGPFTTEFARLFV